MTEIILIRHKPLYNKSINNCNVGRHDTNIYCIFLSCSQCLHCRPKFILLHLIVVWYRINIVLTSLMHLAYIVQIVDIAILDGVQLTFCILFTYYRCLNIVSLLCISIKLTSTTLECLTTTNQHPCRHHVLLGMCADVYIMYISRLETNWLRIARWWNAYDNYPLLPRSEQTGKMKPFSTIT